ncbi:hypothetical protein OG455_11760 [Kitasatospora sp. NBC_01287]|uniref:hypothetical protein n=1 Tax=Kitasatospora sp. NBC_01287 TaxID=2903573 RepID=UPI002258A220|nr:hypothetical protein [Kitasatospora sp. NBC_01287]MCX4746191.1 hypothetical protein [Kitasatospora sp. NBC_01287]
MTDPPSIAPPRIALPPRHQWRLGRCVCCDRQTLVAPGPQIPAGEGALVTLPFCLVGFERAGRHLHRIRLRAAVTERA